jgi:hypothetical protein
MDEYNEELHHEEHAGLEAEVNDDSLHLGIPYWGTSQRNNSYEEYPTLSHYLTSMVYPLKTLMSFFSSLIYCVEVMIMLIMLKN